MRRTFLFGLLLALSLTALGCGGARTRQEQRLRPPHHKKVGQASSLSLAAKMTGWKPVLRQNLVNHFALHVGQAFVLAVVQERQLRVVEAEQVQNRRVEVVDVNAAVDAVQPELVGRAVDESRPSRRRRPSPSRTRRGCGRGRSRPRSSACGRTRRPRSRACRRAVRAASGRGSAPRSAGRPAGTSSCGCLRCPRARPTGSRLRSRLARTARRARPVAARADSGGRTPRCPCGSSRTSPSSFRSPSTDRPLPARSACIRNASS